MALTRKHVQLKSNEDTGFGTNPDNYGGRFINRDGTFNVKKEGLPFFQRFSLYHTMLNMQNWKFYETLFAFYLAVNFIFACIYFVIGPVQFQGILATGQRGTFKEMFFFSTETFTIVGYVRVNHVGDSVNSIDVI
jgi:inward rectifier potassium channel